MKTILIILDGISEEKVPELNEMTPLEYADTPTIDKIIKKGSCAKTTFYPFDREPDSLNCILSILGVEEKLIPKNRAYLEAVAENIHIKHDEVVLRCNLVSIKNNKLESFNGKGLSSSEMEIAAQNVKVSGGIKFHHISNYRNLLIVNKNKLTAALKNAPPHENIGQSIDELLMDIKNIKVINEFVEDNKITINNIDYMFYPWGVSEIIKLPEFSALHNKSCSCVCSAEIVKGIAKCMNIDLPELKYATGDIDTDLVEKANAVMNEIKSHDVVIAHINGTDEVSHRKDLLGKIKFIEKIDREFLSTIYEKNNENTKIIIVSDHQTSSQTGKHEKGYVDLIMNITKNQRRGTSIWLK